MRLVVVDNDSHDNTAGIVQRHDDVIFVPAGGNIGYGGGLNLAPVQAPPRLCCFSIPISRSRTTLSQACSRGRVSQESGQYVPLFTDGDGAPFPSLRREPSLMRAMGDAVLGRRFPNRPIATSEIDRRRKVISWLTTMSIGPQARP